MIANVVKSFFLMAECYSIVYMDHIFLIQSSVEGHLSSFHNLAIVDRGRLVGEGREGGEVNRRGNEP